MAKKNTKDLQRRSKSKLRNNTDKAARRSSAAQVEPEATVAPSDKKIFTSTSDERRAFWTTFIRAVEAEPVAMNSITGASGLVHPVVAVGIDRSRQRLIIVSGDPDGRSAALVQADVQAAQPDLKVIVARPLAINLAKAAEALVDFFGKAEISNKDLARLSTLQNNTKRLLDRRAKQLLEIGVWPAIQALGYAALNVPAVWQDVVSQLSHVQFVSMSTEIEQNGPLTPDKGGPIVKFGNLAVLDPAEVDRRTGVCSLPLYDLTAEGAEIFHRGVDIEAARHLLKVHDIFQYFFPAPDQLALGLIDKNRAPQDVLVEWLRRPPEVGHPLGQTELVPSVASLTDVVDSLKERGFSVDGEIGLELTETGKQSRATVKFTPREGFLSKLSRIVSIKVDFNLADLFKRGP